MDTLWKELAPQILGTSHLVRVSIRLSAAVILVAIVGFQRERTHHSAGLRTHMLVALGAALFTVIPLEAGASVTEVTRVIQGIAAGIGFIGGGVILKVAEQQVKGLTTAASIWMSAAIGVAAGLGQVGPALVGILLSCIILVGLEPIDRRLRGAAPRRDGPGSIEQAKRDK